MTEPSMLPQLAFLTFLIVNGATARTDRERSFARTMALIWLAVALVIDVVLR